MKQEAVSTIRAFPRFVRAPARGREFFSGFSRSKLYQLERKGEIRGIAIREEQARSNRGIKLFDLQSIFDYVERQACANTKSGNGDAT